MLEYLWPEAALSIVAGYVLWSIYSRNRISKCLRQHSGEHIYTVLSPTFDPYFYNESKDEAEGELTCLNCGCTIAPNTWEWDLAKQAMPSELHLMFEARLEVPRKRIEA